MHLRHEQQSLRPGTAGSGRLHLKRTATGDGIPDIAVAIVLKGLDASCEGKQLFPALRFRLVIDACNGGQSCTTPDFQDMALADQTGGCTVKNGKCSYKTTLGTVYPQFTASAVDMIFVPLECDIREQTTTAQDPRIGCSIWPH